MTEIVTVNVLLAQEGRERGKASARRKRRPCGMILDASRLYYYYPS